MKMPPASQMLYLLTNCLGTFVMTFIGLYEFPVFYVDMFILIGLLVVPVGAFLSSAILSGVMRLLRFKAIGLTIGITIIVAAGISTICYVESIGSFNVQGYFSHLYYSRMDYEQAVSQKMTYHLADEHVEDSLKKKLQANYIVTNAKTVEQDDDLVIFEAMAPSILYGNVVYDGVYSVKEDQIMDLVSTDDIWNQVLVMEHLPSSLGFDRENVLRYFNEQRILFSTNHLKKGYDVTWTVKNDKIQIQDVHPEQTTVYKGQ